MNEFIRIRLPIAIYYFLLALFNFTLRKSPFFAVRRRLLCLLGWNIARNAAIHRDVRITSLTKPCSIGAGSVINRGTLLDNRCPIEIADHVSVSQDSAIYTFGHDIDSSDFAGKGNGVQIKSRAVLFSRVTVMPGVTIGTGAVVLPCSVVTKNVENFAVVGGNPALFIRYRESDLRYELDYRVWFGI